MSNTKQQIREISIKLQEATADTDITDVQFIKMLEIIDSYVSEQVREALDELIEWYEVKTQMSAQPFNWYGAVKALKVSKDFKKPFNVLQSPNPQATSNHKSTETES